jgi:ABC-type sugar transport system ATPase subunit
VEVSYAVSKLQKEFSGVYAVEDATFEVHDGTIHGVIGKNGAGKSVLMNMIAGAMHPSGGELIVRGKNVLHEYRHWTPRTAQQMGISLIPQEPPKLPFLTVEDYLFLGDRRFINRGFLDLKSMRREVAEIDEQLELAVRPSDPLATLPIEVQQLLAFGKAVFLEKSKVILLDEITASLSGGRRIALLRQLRGLAEGRSFTLITHHINEVMTACDKVTVMRDGVSVDTLDVAGSSHKELAGKITGEMGVVHIEGGAEHKYGREVLKLTGLGGERGFEDVDLTVHEHEVLGLAGVEGSGKDEMLEAVAGLRQAATGRIEIDGRGRHVRKPRDAARYGVAYLTKKREEYATIHNLTVLENLLLPVARRFAGPLGLLRDGALREIALKMVRQMQVKPPDPDAIINTLSGGNRQKVMIGRLRLMTPRVYLLNEPTRGVDISTKPELLRVIRHELTANSGVIMTSEAEEELVDTCDRILVFYKGRIVKETRRGDADFKASEVYRASQGVEAA